MKERKIMPFDKNFVPALRFAVMSDIHIDDEDCIEEQRFAKALDDLKNLCSSGRRFRCARSRRFSTQVCPPMSG